MSTCEDPFANITVRGLNGELVPVTVSSLGEVEFRGATRSMYFNVANLTTGEIYQPHIGERVMVTPGTNIELQLLPLDPGVEMVIHRLLHRKQTDSVATIVANHTDSDDVAEVATLSMSGNGAALKFFSERLRDKKALVLRVLQQDGDALEHVSERLRDNEEVVMVALSAKSKSHGRPLRHVSDRLRGTRRVVMQGIRQNGNSLKFASEDLQGDPRVVMAALEYFNDSAISYDCMVMKYAANNLKADKDFAMRVVKKNAYSLEFLDASLRTDIDVVMAAVMVNGDALQGASHTMCAHRGVVMTAIANYGYALSYACNRLRADRKVVRAAIEKDPMAIIEASDELKNDREMAMTAIQSPPHGLESPRSVVAPNNEAFERMITFDPSCVVIDPETCCYEQLGLRGYILWYLPEKWKSDKELVMEAVRQNGRALRCASDTMREDVEVVMTAVLQDGLALKYASESLRSDENVVHAAIMQNRHARFYACTKSE